jgi:hypothetical protein
MFGRSRKPRRPPTRRHRRSIERLDERPGTCVTCGSRLVQLRSWRERADGRLRLETSCPECLHAQVGEFEPREALAWDDEVTRGREALERTYRALLRDNMVGELRRLHIAFELDLVCADDWK